jgi:hypothetical protein
VFFLRYKNHVRSEIDESDLICASCEPISLALNMWREVNNKRRHVDRQYKSSKFLDARTSIQHTHHSPEMETGVRNWEARSSSNLSRPRDVRPENGTVRGRRVERGPRRHGSIYSNMVRS